jgi:hypothetical protein
MVVLPIITQDRDMSSGSLYVSYTKCRLLLLKFTKYVKTNTLLKLDFLLGPEGIFTVYGNTNSIMLHILVASKRHFRLHRVAMNSKERHDTFVGKRKCSD